MRIWIYLKPNIGDPLKDSYGYTQDLCSGRVWDNPSPSQEMPICNDLETDTAIGRGDKRFTSSVAGVYLTIHYLAFGQERK
jgi:hypothetical protein